MDIEAKLLRKAIKRNAGDVDRVPGDERRAAVLAEDKAGDGLGVDAKRVREQLAKARGVEHCSGGKQALARIVVFLDAEIR